MSDCVYKIGEFCMMGMYDGKPTESDCKSCDSYSGADRGLGDKVDRIAAKTGIKSLAAFVEKKTGKPCGCGKRRTKLNEMFPTKEQ